MKNPVTGGWRLTLPVRPKQREPIELRAFLDRVARCSRETWSYAPASRDAERRPDRARERAATIAAAARCRADRLLQDWKEAHDRAHAYLAALGVPRGGARGARAATRPCARAVDAADGSRRGDAIARRCAHARELVRAAAAPGRRSRRPSLPRAGALGDARAGRRGRALPPRRRRATPPLARRAWSPSRSSAALAARLIGRAPAAGRHRRAARRSPRQRRAARLAVDARRAPPPASCCSAPGADPDHRRQRLHGERAAAPGRHAGSRSRSSSSSARSSAGSRSASGRRCSASACWRAAATASRSRACRRRSPRERRRRIDAGAARTAIVMPICERAGRARVRRPAGHPPLARSAPARSTHFHFFVLSDTHDPEHRGRARRRRGPLVPRGARLRPHLLPPPASARSSARAATSPTSAAAGARATAT